MDYQHRFYDQQPCHLPAAKVVCVGRNYLQHIAELKNEVPTEPVLFIKPNTALTAIENPIIIAEEACHHEVELAILIGEKLQKEASVRQIKAAIVGYGIALDLTLRDVQHRLKEKGLPWERAKAFDNSCPISAFIPAEQFEADPQATSIALKINGEYRQNSYTHLMITPILALIQNICVTFTLLPGDVILTGTPEGVGALTPGDSLELELAGSYFFQTQVQK